MEAKQMKDIKKKEPVKKKSQQVECSVRAELLQDMNKTHYLQRKKMAELEEDKVYRIIKLEHMETKFGKAILATLNEDEGNEDDFTVFLPKRFSKMWSEEQIKAINQQSIKMKYKGGKYNEVEFY